MTIWRLMDGQGGRPGNGPAAPTAFAGNFTEGLAFQVTSFGLYFQGYFLWVPPGGDTFTGQKFALWQLTNNTAGTLITGSAVTAGTLTAGQWNFVPLATPVPLTAAIPYVAASGRVSVAGFGETKPFFNAAGGFTNGITSGPLQAYSDIGASNPAPNNWLPQGVFSTAGADPSATFPTTGDTAANFWIDVQMTDQVPAGSSYRLWPSMPVPPNMISDTATNFTLATEFKLSQACALNKIWFYSPPGTTQLPTVCGIWAVAGQAVVPGTQNNAPAWSGAAGSGFVSCSYAGVTLPAGDYKVSVFNGAAVPVIWNNASADYFDTGGGASGIINGPLSAPSEAGAATPGQASYHQGVTFAWPDTYAGAAPSYWVDAEVTPAPATLVIGDDDMPWHLRNRA